MSDYDTQLMAAAQGFQLATWGWYISSNTLGLFETTWGYSNYWMEPGETYKFNLVRGDGSSVEPQALIDDIVENELKNVDLTHYPTYNSSMPRDRYGQALPGKWTEIGPVAIEKGRRETLITIVHEEMHHRLDIRGWYQSEAYVEAVAQRFARMINSLMPR
jgi:hypothetical protein